MAARNLGSITNRPTDARSGSSADTAVAQAFLASTVGGESLSTTDAPKRRRARFHALEVAEVRPLTADAVEVTFAVPEELADEYTYLPGQYVALRTELEGHERRRSYSICRPPERGSISVAIKRDLGGLFSTWANSELKAGDSLDVMSPQGTFTSTLDALDGKHIVGIAAGSGITPLMALAHTVLSRSATAEFELVYTNRSTLDVMFLEECDAQPVLRQSQAGIQASRTGANDDRVVHSGIEFPVTQLCCQRCGLGLGR